MRFIGPLAEGRDRYRLLAAVAIVVGVLSLAQTDADAVVSFLGPLTFWTVRITLALLSAAGMEASEAANVIYHANGFAYEIHYRCTGIVPAAAYAILTLGCPGSAARKTRLLAVGMPLLIALNFARLVHLFYIGVHEPGAFDFAHSVLWQGVLILTVLVLSLVSVGGTGKRALTHRLRAVRSGPSRAATVREAGA